MAMMTACSFAADGWTNFFNDGSVSVTYKRADCHDTQNDIHQQKVLLRWTNLSGKTIVVSFTKELKYTEQLATGTDAGYRIELKPDEVKEGDCQTKDKALFIFAKHLNWKGKELTSFDLKNISVKIID